MAKIGIIAVFYNLEKYARNCLESIKNQTFQDFTCVCIDDNSSDQTFEILKNIAKDDKRFAAIQNERNYGSASHSRNVGLEKITGCEYFMFVDGDDLLHPKTLEIAYKTVLGTNADFVSWELQRFEDESEILDLKNDDMKISDLQIYENPMRLFLEKSKNLARANVYNKLYIYEKYKNFRFYEDIFYEDDYMYALQILAVSSLHVRISKPPLYFYRRHEQSITYKLRSERYLNDAINRMKHTYEYFIAKGNIPKGLDKTFKTHMTNDAYRMIIRKTLGKTKDKKLFEKLIPLAKKEFKNLLEINAIELNYLNLFQKIIVKQFLGNNIMFAKILVKIFR
jgi:glycosyltransferase involved in cell wall biosynthesis